MRSKTCTLHVISLCLLPLLTAGCLSDNLLSDHPDTPTGPIEIRIKSSIVGSTSATTRAETSPVEKGMITEDMTFNVKFARVDATDDGATPTYSAAYTKAVSGTVTSKVLSFTDPEYYQPDGKKTKLIGWYPAVDTYATSTDNVSTVTFSVDGETDIMATPLKEGDKTSKIESIAFEHLLTQISVKVYATDANTKALWGGLESVSIAGKKQTCVLTLPATSSSAETKITTKTFAAADGGVLPLVKKLPTIVI